MTSPGNRSRISKRSGFDKANSKSCKHENLYRAVEVKKEPKMGIGTYRMRDPEECAKNSIRGKAWWRKT